MSCINCLLFNIFYLTAIYCYPTYKFLTNKVDKLWVLYFMILGAYSLLQSKFLFLFRFLIFNNCILYILYTIKALFFLWLYHPTFLGALLLDSLYGKIIDNIFSKINPKIGQHLTKLGYINKAALISDIKSRSNDKNSDDERNPLLTKEDNEDNEINKLKSKKQHVLPEYKKLNNGIEIPFIGLGTSRINDIIDVVYNSIKDGVRLIDTAFKYGNEEKME